MIRLAGIIAATLLFAMPVAAGWKAMPAGKTVAVVDESLSVTPTQSWNRWTRRPSKFGEVWTLDGLALNELTFFAGVPSGKAIYHDRLRRNRPLPKFKSDMLLTDLAELFESSNRIVLQTSLFEIEETQPARLAGHDAVRFSYSYAIQGDELKRKGEAVATIVDGKFYMVNFVAPALHYFDRDIGNVRKLVDTATIPG